MPIGVEAHVGRRALAAPRATVLLLSIIAFVLPLGCQHAPTNADEVLARHVQAVGGVDRWHAASPRTMHADVQLVSAADPAGKTRELSGTTLLIRKAPDKLLSTTTLVGVGTIRQGYDGSVGWMQSPGGAPTRLTGFQLDDLKREALFDYALDLRTGYVRAELMGSFDLRTVPCWRVRMEAADGAIADAFFDQRTGLCVALSRALRNGDASVQVTRYFSDYKEFCGILLPTRVEQTVGGGTQTEVLRSVECTPVEDAMFDPPPSVQSH